MISPAVTAFQDASVAAAAEMMMTTGIGYLPVVDDHQLIGVVAKTDLFRCLCVPDAAWTR